VFVLGKTFQASLMFVCKASVYSSEAPRLGSWFYPQTLD
jgi:hypothetical protein